MDKVVITLAQFTRRHLKTFFIIALTLIIFLSFSSYAIEEKSGLSRLWIGVVSLFAGATAGGIAGALVGGIGLAALGTAVGIPGLAVVGLGALFGGVFVGSIGTGIGAYLSDPATYEVNQWMLAGILAASLAASTFIVFCANRIFMWTRTRVVMPNWSKKSRTQRS